MTWSKQGANMGTRWHTLRKKVIKASDGTCYLCGNPATEVDHIISRASGGSDSLDNLAPVCSTCHARKSAAEGHAALKRKRELRRRPADKHPGRFYD